MLRWKIYFALILWTVLDTNRSKTLEGIQEKITQRRRNTNKIRSCRCFGINSSLFSHRCIHTTLMCECYVLLSITAAFRCISVILLRTQKIFCLNFKVFSCVFHRFSYFPTACTNNSFTVFASFPILLLMQFHIVWRFPWVYSMR